MYDLCGQQVTLQPKLRHTYRALLKAKCAPWVQSAVSVYKTLNAHVSTACVPDLKTYA